VLPIEKWRQPKINKAAEQKGSSLGL
jgi:hypothetical protein